MKTSQSILPKGYLLDDQYTIMLLIKSNLNAETYRVKGMDGKLYFLKLFNYTKLHRTAFDKEGNILEIEFCRTIQHPHIVSYKDSGELIYDGKKFAWLVLKFIPGETLSERMNREPIASLYDIRQILSGVLNGLQYLHSLPNPIIHNELTPQNIMLDMSDDIPQAKIIDFGYARSFLQSSKTFNREGLDLCFVASECITAGIFSPQSDLFSVGAVMYQMLFAVPPWNVQLTNYQVQHQSDTAISEKLLQQREKPLAFPDVVDRVVDFDDAVLKIITKALHNDVDKRFQSANEFLLALNGETPVEEEVDGTANLPFQAKKGSVVLPGKSKGGFEAIAGMYELKSMLQSDVIDIMRHPEEYEKHGLGLPNGMLMYGPPGCGKTFFAERFAEETGYNFRKVISSDIASIYVHGTQEKIGKIFDEARNNAPAILFFDELDAMTPDRENAQHSYGSEVNEFLSQLDNIGNSGVFVIGSTNKPQLIDKAILRAGRLEKHFYIPPPDFEARRAMFEIYLKKRPIDFGIDYDRLATLTENYVSGDIKLIVDEASRLSIKERNAGNRQHSRIMMSDLELIISKQKPSVSEVEMKKFEQIRFNMEGGKTERRRVGFI